MSLDKLEIKRRECAKLIVYSIAKTHYKLGALSVLSQDLDHYKKHEEVMENDRKVVEELLKKLEPMSFGVYDAGNIFLLLAIILSVAYSLKVLWN